MVFFITCLRALAACLITNSHYTSVYPTDLIANGGLLGDVLFFAVSGYCLYNIKLSFPRWYGKRLYRVYPPVIVITLVYMLLGFYSVSWNNAFNWFVFPTHYHFVASIVLLYIFYYIVIKIKALCKHIPIVMAFVAVIWLAVYLVFYDKSYYHIDSVYEPMIEFLFFESMLLGAYFRQNDKKFRNHFSWLNVIGFVVAFIAYFASKTAFSKMESISVFQPVNQILIILVLYFLFCIFAGIDSRLEKSPKWIKGVISFVSKMTLEIYVVQYFLEDELRSIAPFPANWFILTLSIIVSAFALHMVCKGFYYCCDKCVQAISSRRKKVDL